VMLFVLHPVSKTKPLPAPPTKQPNHKYLQVLDSDTEDTSPTHSNSATNLVPQRHAHSDAEPAKSSHFGQLQRKQQQRREPENDFVARPITRPVNMSLMLAGNRFPTSPYV